MALGVPIDHVRECLYHLPYAERDRIIKLLTTRPSSPEELIKKYLPCKLWRLNNLYKIITTDAQKQQEAKSFNVQFVMNRVQWMIHGHALKYPRLIILKARQLGMSTFFLVSFFDDALTNEALTCGLIAQKMERANELLERVRFLWDNVHPFYKDLLGLSATRHKEGYLVLSNKSKVMASTSFRGGFLHRLHVSEYGAIARDTPNIAKRLWTDTVQALPTDMPFIIESTAAGHNDFYTRYQDAKTYHSLKNPRRDSSMFYPVFFPWQDEARYKVTHAGKVEHHHATYFQDLENLNIQLTKQQKNFFIFKSKEITDRWDLHREFPATEEHAFVLSQDGSYWLDTYNEHVLLQKRIKTNLYNPALDIYVAQDVGQSDYWCMIFFQWNAYDKMISIVGEYYNNQQTWEHYAEYIQKQQDYYKQKFARILLPHDSTKRSGFLLTGSDNTVRQSFMQRFGLKNVLLLERQPLKTSIDAVNIALRQLEIDKDCQYIIQCIKQYSRFKDPKTDMWSDQPMKSKYNHGADALRYCIQYIDTFLAPIENIQMETPQLWNSPIKHNYPHRPVGRSRKISI